MHRILDTSGKCILGCTFALIMLASAGGAKAATFELLYTFQGGSGDGGDPRGGVIADAAGNLYGTTWLGGGTGCDEGCGIVFKLAPDGTETVLHAFVGGGDGAEPFGGVIADKGGNLYGTAGVGGSNGFGAVFKVTPDGTEKVLYSFRGSSDGAAPEAGLILRNRELYGTTIDGGGTSCFFGEGCGTVFKVALDGTETVLHDFYRRHSDGRYPYAGLVADSAGNLYGTTTEGSLACAGHRGCGTVFKLAPDGTETTLYAFHGNHGTFPYANLILDSAGNLYGTTLDGGGTFCGGSGCGVVFKLAPDGAETVLHTFCNQTNCTDGGLPHAGVIADKAGNLYGTTTLGGPGTACSGSGCGTVFKLAPDGTETLLYTFTGGSDGSNPQAGLLLRKGYLYGTATAGGGGSCSGTYVNGCGTVFRVKL